MLIQLWGGNKEKSDEFRLRNNSSLTISGSNELLSAFKCKPASENSHSEGTEVAGMKRYFWAI